MSYKSRSNYPVNFCMKADCINRETRCAICLHFSEYRKTKEGEQNDQETQSEML